MRPLPISHTARGAVSAIAGAAPLGLVVAAVTLTGCGVEFASGDQTTLTFDPEPFTAIEISSAIQAEIIVGEAMSVQVDVDDSLVDDLEVDVTDGKLVISLDSRSINLNAADTEARISTPTLDALDVSGASSVDVVDVDADRFELDASGASSVEVDGRIDDLVADVSGASQVDLDGVAIDTAQVDVSGASSVELDGATSVNGSASGASNIDVSDDASVAVDVSGASSVD